MAAKYWIKLYHEILQDPKMGRLPDNLWRRCIELFLLAGELGAEVDDDDKGHLPPTEELAWHLRQPESTLETELSRLAEVGILTKTETGWTVTNFAKRQKYVDTAERMRQYRERKRLKELQSSDDNDKEIVTRNVTFRNAESDTDIESRKSDKSPAPIKRQKPTEIPAAKIFVEVTGKGYVLNKTQIKEIGEVIGHDPPMLEKWRCVVKEWQLAGYKLTNIKGMLDWFRDGIPAYQKQQNGIKNGTPPPAVSLPPDKAARYQELLKE